MPLSAPLSSSSLNAARSRPWPIILLDYGLTIGPFALGNFVCRWTPGRAMRSRINFGELRRPPTLARHLRRARLWACTPLLLSCCIFHPAASIANNRSRLSSHLLGGSYNPTQPPAHDGVEVRRLRLAQLSTGPVSLLSGNNQIAEL